MCVLAAGHHLWWSGCSFGVLSGAPSCLSLTFLHLRRCFSATMATKFVSNSFRFGSGLSAEAGILGVHLCGCAGRGLVVVPCWWSLFQEYEETCLFIVARFSANESLRVFINILKIPPPFASNEGYPASGFRYESAGTLVSNPLPHSSSLATARRRVLISSRFLYLFLPLFLYIVIFILNYYFYSDIITL